MSNLVLTVSVSAPWIRTLFGEDPSPAQRQNLEELSNRNQDIFSELAALPGPRGRSRADALRRQPLDDESYSSWSSLIVAVPKPDGSLRLCNDFCQLNAVSTFDRYPLP